MHESSELPSMLEVSLVPESTCLFLALGGELDVASADEVPRDDFAARHELTTVLVDLGELTFCDASGLRALLVFRRIHEAQGRTVQVVRATPFIWRLMRLCGVTDRLEPAPPAGTTNAAAA
jgi:anti-anti-sigma factor